jgi:hypothetical protein
MSCYGMNTYFKCIVLILFLPQEKTREYRNSFSPLMFFHLQAWMSDFSAKGGVYLVDDWVLDIHRVQVEGKTYTVLGNSIKRCK